MSNKQLGIIIGTTVLLALLLAWTIEKAQVRAFMTELDKWWYERNSSGKE